MKKSKIVLIVIILIITCVIFIPPLFGKSAVVYAEEDYIENPTDENLYELCKIAFTDKENEYIIKYFPKVLKDGKFDNLISNNITEELSTTDLKNIYIDSYLYACYEEYSYENFKSEFIKVFPYFVYEKNSMSDYTKYLQVHFWPKFAVDKELTKTYCDVLKIIYQDENLPQDVRDDGYQFIREWYGEIGDLDSYFEIKKITDAIEAKQADSSVQDRIGDGSAS